MKAKRKSTKVSSKQYVLTTYDIDKALAVDIPGGQITVLSMSLNSAMHDLKIPVAFTIRETDESIQLIVETVSQ